MSRRSSVSYAFCVVLAVLAASATAKAEPTSRADASASFREAQAAFARRDFAAAAAAFEQAARAAPHPATWLNAAEAWEKREDWARAAEDCDRALEVPGADEDLRREAGTRLRAALERVATLEVRGAGGYGARVDRGSVQPLPLRRRLTPGSHEVVLVDLASGREELRTVSIGAGQSKTIDAPTPATPSAAAPTKPASGPPTAAWLALGLGGAAAVTTGVLGFVTLSDKRAFEDHPTQDGLDGFHRDRLLTNVALGVAVVALGTGIALWVFAPSRNPEPRAAHLEF